jgi:hypothetical protein
MIIKTVGIFNNFFVEVAIMNNKRFRADRENEKERMDCIQGQMKKLATIAHSLHNMNMSAIKSNRLKKEKAQLLMETKMYTKQSLKF